MLDRGEGRCQKEAEDEGRVFFGEIRAKASLSGCIEDACGGLIPVELRREKHEGW